MRIAEFRSIRLCGRFFFETRRIASLPTDWQFEDACSASPAARTVMMTRSRIPLSVVLLVLGASSAPAKDFPKFERIEIDPHAGEVVYAVTHADVNGDEKDDIVAVTENAVYWYENRDWKK